MSPNFAKLTAGRTLTWRADAPPMAKPYLAAERWNLVDARLLGQLR